MKKHGLFKMIGFPTIIFGLLFSSCGQPAGGNNSGGNTTPSGGGDTKPVVTTGSFDKDSSSDNVFKYTDSDGNVFVFTEGAVEETNARFARDAEDETTSNTDGATAEGSENETTPDVGTDLDVPESSEGEEGSEVPPADAENPGDSAEEESKSDGTWTYTKKDQDEPYYSGTYKGNASGIVESNLTLVITKQEGSPVKTTKSFDFAIAATEESTTFSIESMPAAVELATLAELEVSTEKTEYRVNDEFNKETLTISAVYNDEARTKIAVSVDDVEITGFDSKEIVAEQKVTVSYKVDENTTLTKEITIEIKAPAALKEIKVTPPTTSTYLLNDDLDLTGAKITAVYEDDSEKEIEITKDMVTGFDSSAIVDSKELTVTYKEGEVTLTQTFSVTITDKRVSKIDISKYPEKKIYIVGEELDKTGLELSVTYEDGTTEKVTDTAKIACLNFDSSEVTNNLQLVFFYRNKEVRQTHAVKVYKYVGIQLDSKAKKSYKINEEYELSISTKLEGENAGSYIYNKVDPTAEGIKIKGFDSKKPAEKQTVTIFYTLAGVTHSIEQTIIIVGLKEIVISVKPTKLEYMLNEDTLDLKGIVAKLYYTDGSVVDAAVEKLTYEGFNTKEATDKLPVTISFDDGLSKVSSTFDISVILPELIFTKVDDAEIDYSKTEKAESDNTESENADLGYKKPEIPFSKDTITIEFTTNFTKPAKEEIQWTLDDDSVYKFKGLNDKGYPVLEFCYEGYIADLKEINLTGTVDVFGYKLSKTLKIQPVRPQSYSEICKNTWTPSYSWIILTTEDESLSNKKLLINEIASSNDSRYFVNKKLKIDLSRASQIHTVDSSFKQDIPWVSSIVFPPEVQNISHSCIHLSELEKVIFTGPVKNFNYSAFEYSGISEIDFPEGIQDLGANAFANTQNLKSIIIPDTVTKLGVETFMNSNLEEIVLPSNPEFTKIRDAFKNCKLKKITIPASVTVLDISAFEDCAELEEVIFEASDKELLLSDKCFKNCSKLTKFDFTSRPLILYNEVFYGSGLEVVDENNKIKKIGDYCFDNTKITSLILPEVEETGFTCTNDSSITKVILGSKFKRGGYFYKSESGKRIPNEVLKEVVILDHDDTAYSISLSDLPNLEKVTFGINCDFQKNEPSTLFNCELLPTDSKKCKVYLPSGTTSIKFIVEHRDLIKSGNLEFVFPEDMCGLWSVRNIVLNDKTFEINVKDYDTINDFILAAIAKGSGYGIKSVTANLVTNNN